MTRFLHVTGNSRSGTTLLQQLLACHDDVDMLSQPFPQLFRAIKQQMHKAIEHPESYFVHGNFYQDTFSTPASVTEYLENTSYSDAFVKNALSFKYSGQLTEGVLQSLEYTHVSGGASELYQSIISALVEHKKGYVGAKHILLEEFTEHFLRQGIKVIMIIRDPRDMLVSAKFGNAKRFVGDTLPMLFELRNWRKSAEFICHYDGYENFYWLKYEELVRDPVSAMMKVFAFVCRDTPDNSITEEQFRQAMDNFVSSNSSFRDSGGVSDASVGQYVEYFDSNTINYINTICAYEMRWLGYECTPPHNIEQTIHNFNEPVPVASDKITADYSISVDRKVFEIGRLLHPQKSDFIFPDNYEKLVVGFSGE